MDWFVRAKNSFHGLKSTYLARLADNLEETTLSLKTGYENLTNIIGPNPATHLTPIVQNLYVAMQNCSQCCALNQEVYNDQEALLHPIPIPHKTSTQVAMDHVIKVLRGSQARNQYVGGICESNMELQMDINDDTGIDDGQAFGMKEIDPSTKSSQKKWKEASIGRFPRPIPFFIPPPKSLLGLKPPFQYDFDDLYKRSITHST